jgi:putative ABC transport system ATP-binding protein
MGASVMIVTHAAATAAMANRVIEFSDGRIRSVTVNDAPVSADMIQW